MFHYFKRLKNNENKQSVATVKKIFFLVIQLRKFNVLFYINAD